MQGRQVDPRRSELLHLLHPPSGTRPWYGGASPVGCLRGVGLDAALWKPYPGGHSIWEQALHIAYWIYAVRRALDGTAMGSFPRSPSNWPKPPDRPKESSWRADRRLLRDEYAGFVSAISRLPPRVLDEPAPGKGNYRHADLLFGVVQHNTHHAGQIQLLKRIYRSRGP